MTINNVHSNNILSGFLSRVGERGMNLAGLEQPPGVNRLPDLSGGEQNRGPAALVMESRAFVTEVRSIGEMIMGLLVDSHTRNQSVFAQMQAESEDTEALYATVEDQGYAYEQNGYTVNVGIHELAMEQLNNGYYLPARELSNVSNGRNEFTLEQNGRTYDFSINVSDADSNRTVQYRMSDAINDQNTGVTATVQFEAGNRQSNLRSYLILASNETGRDNSFTLADVPNRGNAVASTGANTVAQPARDAVYTVNGAERTSARNVVELGEGVRAALRDTTDTDIAVSIRTDTEGIANTIGNVVNNFNEMLQSTANISRRDSSAYELLQRMDNLFNTYESSLRDIGVTRSQDGVLQIDNARLNNAIEQGTAENTLQSGFTNRLTQLGQAATSNPTQFVSTRTRNDMNVVDTGYRNGNRNGYANGNGNGNGRRNGYVNGNGNGYSNGNVRRRDSAVN
jgi:flagellar capping protein FliD